MLRRLLHRLAHILLWNRGSVVTEWRGGDLFIGFQCSDCGEVSSWERVPERLYP